MVLPLVHGRALNSRDHFFTIVTFAHGVVYTVKERVII